MIWRIVYISSSNTSSYCNPDFGRFQGSAGVCGTTDAFARPAAADVVVVGWSVEELQRVRSEIDSNYRRG